MKPIACNRLDGVQESLGAEEPPRVPLGIIARENSTWKTGERALEEAVGLNFYIQQEFL